MVPTADLCIAVLIVELVVKSISFHMVHSYVINKEKNASSQGREVSDTHNTPEPPDGFSMFNRTNQFREQSTRLSRDLDLNNILFLFTSSPTSTLVYNPLGQRHRVRPVNMPYFGMDPCQAGLRRGVGKLSQVRNAPIYEVSWEPTRWYWREGKYRAKEEADLCLRSLNKASVKTLSRHDSFTVDEHCRMCML